MAAAILLPVNACKKPVSPLEGLQLIIDYNLIKTTTDIQFTDITTGQVLSGEASRGAYVSYQGPEKNWLLTCWVLRRLTRSLLSTVGLPPWPIYPVRAMSRA